jgi:hypothetical protein
MTSSIFDSLVEKYLHTPKVFEQYLLEQPPEDEIQSQIWEQLLASPTLCIEARTLQKQLDLTPAQFHETMLHLEFRFLCCVSYRQNGDIWEEVVTPFAEWHDYQRHLTDSLGVPLEEDKISIDLDDPLAQIEKLSALLKQVQGGANSISDPSALERLLQIEFLAEEGGSFTVTVKGKEWLEMTPFDKAVTLYRHPLRRLISDKELRMTEKALQRVMDHGWVPFSSFFNNIVEPLGDVDPVVLKCMSRGRWGYELPQLGDEQRAMVEEIVCERLAEAGITATGVFEGEPCFKITPFGKMVLA